MHIGNSGNQSPLSLLGDSFRSDHDPDGGNVSGRSNAPSSTGATYMGSTRWVNTVIGVEAPEHSPNAVALRGKLHQIFEPHITGQNRQAFEQLIDQRAIRLNEMGETPEDVEATLAKGQKLDRLSKAVVGTVRSVPFAIASRLLDTVPGLTAMATTPAMVGFVAGVFSGAFDCIGDGLVKRATSDTQWLTAKQDELEPVMADAAKAREPSSMRTTLEVGAAFQTYSLRNVLRTGAAALATEKMSPKGAAELDSWMATAGGPVAGGAAYLVWNRMDEKNHRTGPEYLLGRRDWEASYKALKEVNPWKDPLINGGKRLLKMPVDVATDGLQSIRKFGTATSVVQNLGALGGGFAGVLSARAAVTKAAEKAGMGPVAQAAISHTVNTFASAPVYFAWTSGAVLAGAAADKAASFIQEKAGSAFDRAANYLHGRPSGSQPLPTEPHDDIALARMEEGHALSEAAGASDHIVLEIVEEEPHQQPPLNAAERHV